MISKELTIPNTFCLESKIAARLIQKTSMYESNIWMQKGGRKANAKSLLGVLSLCIGRGETIQIIVDGNDEDQASTDLENFIKIGMTE